MRSKTSKNILKNKKTRALESDNIQVIEWPDEDWEVARAAFYKKEKVKPKNKKPRKTEAQRRSEEILQFGKEFRQLVYKELDDKKLILEVSLGYCIVASLDKINVNIKTNPDGFQPHERAVDKTICSLTILEWVDKDIIEHNAILNMIQGSTGRDLFKRLEKIGCPKIIITSKHQLIDVLKNL